MSEETVEETAQEKMSKVDAGRLGGLVCKTTPGDLLRGNPEAQPLALRIGKRKKGGPKIVPELYERDPDVVILLCEHFLHFDEHNDAAYEPWMVACRAAYATVKQLREINWENFDEASSSFWQSFNEAEIYMAAQAIIQLGQEKPAKRAKKAPKR